MDRSKLMEAILKHDQPTYKNAMVEALKRLSDTNLIAFAIDLGIDTDALFSGPRLPGYLAPEVRS